jgi:hypothetical protein
VGKAVKRQADASRHEVGIPLVGRKAEAVQR